MSTRDQAAEIVRQFLARADKDPEVTPTTSLHTEGLGLDSLELAELSAMLEDELSTDPFSQGLLPETVGELLDFYDVVPAV